jgi:DNA-binding XRE family transcriptional regulator
MRLIKKCYPLAAMTTESNSNRRRVPLPVRRALDDVASELSGWRKLRGLTQAQLADRAGVERKTVARLEHGDGTVSI